MGGDLKIQQLCDKLNRDINSPLFLPLLKSKGNGSHERAFTSLDVIEDTQGAIEEFDALSEKNIQDRTTLYIYGVMQALYCQQDGVYHLYKTIVDPDIKNVYKLFTKYNFSKNIRNQRDDIAGHPADRHTGKEFYFIAKRTNSKYQFTYAGYTPEFKKVDVDLKKSITEQKAFIMSVLKDVETKIKKKVKNHKETFRNKKLTDYLKILEQSYKYFYDAIFTNKPVADLGIETVNGTLADCKKELLARYHQSLPNSVSDILRILDHIMTRFSEWNKAGDLYGNTDAEIFLDSYEKQVNELKDIFYEIDKEFNTEDDQSE